MSSLRRLETILTGFSACLLLTLTVASSAFAADFAMKVTEKNYLDTQGFSVFLYDSTYHPVFVDQKNTAMEMILHGQRIATNGDVRLMPTPEQWDLVATLKGRQADKANNRLTASLAFPTFDVSYTLEVAAEPGGVRVSINLDKPLPPKLVGRAGFNLEFLPSIYMGKTYLVDGSNAGIFPRTPNDPMIKVLPLPDEPKKAYYLEDWDKAKGYTQPLPFAEGKKITLGVDDSLARITVVSDTAALMLFDGRNRAQNGWFVLRSLIPSGKTTGAIVWHLKPDVISGWTRPPVIAHSQVGYAPGFSKVAVLELDPKYTGPRTAKVLRLTEGGAYQQVFEGPITPSTPWLRYVYSKFDFTTVRDPRSLCHIEPTQVSVPHRFPSPRMPTRTSGRTAWTITWRHRWITFQCAKPIACGTAPPTWMTAAWRPWWASNSTTGIRRWRRMASTRVAIIFLE